MNPSTWRHFYKSLHKNSCILILGPRIATFLGESGEEQIDQAFSRQLSKEIEDKNNASTTANKISFDSSQRDNLPYASMRWTKGLRMKDTILREELCSFFDNSVSRPPKIYKDLAKLPFSLVINTSPDEYMHQAFMRVGKEAEQLHYNYQRNQASLTPEISIDKPVVYNLFGTIEETESLVITKEDQVNFINNLLGNTSTLPNEILQHFDEHKTYLFLGFDSNDWHLPLLFRSLRLHKEKEMSFYLHDSPIKAATKDFYIDSFDFQFVSNDENTFVHDLAQGYIEWEESQKGKSSNTNESSKPSYITSPQPGVKGKVNILMMTANPKDTAAIELNDEIDVIEEVHMRGTERSKFFFKPILNTKKARLLELLLRHNPQIVHFSGHGTGRAGLVFYGESGSADMVQGPELANLFKQFNTQISCVILNACYSEEQAQVMAQYIPNVIGTNNAIDDQVAIKFTEGFYTAIFAGKNYEDSFNLGIAHVGLHSFPEGGRPVFYKDGKKIDAA
ncbi:MAG: CHAT domain-containing protein [Aureispira sp.]|nr:CHAT domain-containing protein [Aureispira sp.]